ncbi:MAG TPA: hypothetical protein VIS07_19545 [Candidatus Binatia bacterium]
MQESDAQPDRAWQTILDGRGVDRLVQRGGSPGGVVRMLEDAQHLVAEPVRDLAAALLCGGREQVDVAHEQDPRCVVALLDDEPRAADDVGEQHATLDGDGAHRFPHPSRSPPARGRTHARCAACELPSFAINATTTGRRG